MDTPMEGVGYPLIDDEDEICAEGEEEAVLVAVAVAKGDEEAVAVAVEDDVAVAVAEAVSDKGMHPGTFQDNQGQYPVVADVEQKEPGSHTISLRYKVFPGPEVAGHWDTSIVVL